MFNPLRTSRGRDPSGARVSDPAVDRVLPPSRQAEWAAEGLPQRYQRLVSNPFLVMSAAAFWLGAIRAAFDAGHFIALVLVFSTIGLWRDLGQYHCLDCGATGWLGDWRKHCCDRVSLRFQAGRPRRFRGPGLSKQTVAWVASTLLVIVLVLRWDR